MRRGLRPVLACAGCALACAGPSAAAQDRCDTAVIAAGDEELSSAVIGSLSPSALAAACEGAELSVERTPAGYRVRLVKDGREVQRDVETIDDAVMWSESWLAPARVSAQAEEPSERASAAPPMAAPERALAPHAPAAAARETSTWHAGVVLDASIDRWSAWLGPELVASWDVAPMLWLGFGLGGGWALDETAQDAEIERSTLRASARGGLRLDVGPGALRFGIGVGIAGFALSRTDASGTLEEEETGIFGAAELECSVPVVGPISVLIGAGGRWHVPELDRDADDVAEAELFQMPELVGSAHVGLAWAFRGAP